jgi:hypothetical protein
MSQPTPGPWVWRWKSGSLHQVGTDRPFGATVLAPSYEYDRGVENEVSEADAALIAAAPDLLKAVRGAYHALKTYQYGNASTELAEEIANFCAAAIAKATGEPPP